MRLSSCLECFFIAPSLPAVGRGGGGDPPNARAASGLHGTERTRSRHARFTTVAATVTLRRAPPPKRIPGDTGAMVRACARACSRRMARSAAAPAGLSPRAPSAFLCLRYRRNLSENFGALTYIYKFIIHPPYITYTFHLHTRAAHRQLP